VDEREQEVRVGARKTKTNMLIKFETKSPRVKGLSFHPSRPWLLASLHSGVIQLWDYRTQLLIDRFDEHEGPVRGVCFHSTQPLFVSGGDDFNIKVWNYKMRKCLFTLSKHLDYIRTVQFHEVSPWILSASDDQTILIWNWQSRQCIATLTGHIHYVMCAQFHPKEDYVVSSSLDNTVRVWDISGLRRKWDHSGMQRGHGGVGMGSLDDPSRQADRMFGQEDVVVKDVLEGHDRGVNWAVFSPSMPYIVSGADDRLIKIWRMNSSDDRVWLVDSLRGHSNNVSCVLYHPRQELILSNSEDKSIRVWDVVKRAGIQTYRRDHDRFWILAAHPRLNLFAGGHDGGLVVFKLQRERPAYELAGRRLYFVRGNTLRVYDMDTSREAAVLQLSRSPLVKAGVTPRRLSYNAAESALLLQVDAEGGSYELYPVPRDPFAEGGSGGSTADGRRGSGTAAVFVARNRFAVLVKSQNKILIKNMNNDTTKTLTCPEPTREMFFAGVGRVLLQTEDKLMLYDVQMSKKLVELPVAKAKFVVWSSSDKDGMAAVVARDSVVVINRRLEQLCSVYETVKIKSAAWDKNGILYYTTLNHIKYCLPNGDSGIIRTLDVPVYLTAVRGNTLYCLDREGKVCLVSVDITESMFKLALMQRRYGTLIDIVKGSNLIGQAIIAYLQEKGFPEIALHFVEDERTRFQLALQCGNIDIATKAALEINDPAVWAQLGRAALRQGNLQVVEVAYQKTQQFEKLAFLFTICGNNVKLGRMLEIAEKRRDPMSCFQSALYLGDLRARVAVLREAGHANLAYVAARVHGLPDLVEEIAEELREQGAENLPPLPRQSALLSPPPVLYRPPAETANASWPQLNVSKDYFAGAAKVAGAPSAAAAPEGSVLAGAEEDDYGDESAAGWGDDLKLPGEDDDAEEDSLDLGSDIGGDGDGEGWGDLDLPDDVEAPAVAPVAGATGVVCPDPGQSPAVLWARGSALAAHHVAAGSFETAMAMMNAQAGISHFAPLKSHFLNIFAASRAALPAFPSTAPQTVYLQRDTDSRFTTPVIPTSIRLLVEKLRAAYKATFEGKFSDALVMFKNILHSTLFIVADSRQEVNEIKELVGICREYILGINLELERKAMAQGGGDKGRQVELSAYFTHCKLQPAHLMLALRSAMTNSYKVKNFHMAGSFARRLLELNPKAEVANQARKVAKLCDRNPVDQHKVDYDFRNPFVICGSTQTPIYQGSPSVRCPFCQTSHTPASKGSVCNVCSVASVGAECSGYQYMAS